MSIPTVQGRDCRTYKVTGGTQYSPSTPDDLILILEGIRLRGIRVRIHYLNHSETGRIVRTFARFPVLVHNTRSLRFRFINEHKIVRIEHSNKRQGGVLWERPGQMVLVAS